MNRDLQPLYQQSANRLVILGRDSEEATFDSLLDSLFQGNRGFAVVTGEAGIGKSTLVRSVTARAAARGAQVLYGTCYEYDLPAPYAVWHDIFSQVDPAENHGLSPPNAGNAGGAEALRASVYQYVVSLAERRPLVLVLEDMQWADESSLDLMRYIVRQRDASATLVIMTSREEDLTARQLLSRMLPLLIREGHPVRISLRPFDEATVHQLVLTRYASIPEVDAERLVQYLLRYSEGNPFLIDELLGMLEYQRVLAHSDEKWHLGDLPAFPVPPLVRQVVDERLERLGGDTRALLEVAAVIGVEIPLDLWRTVSQATDDALSAAISDALRERVIEESRGASGYQFRHALIRGVLYERLSFARRRELHRRAADALSTLPGAEPGVVAHHYLQTSDIRAARWLIEAGTQAARSFALRDASANYERALGILEHETDGVTDRIWLLCALAEAHRFTDADRALDYVNRAIAALDQHDDGAMRALALWCQARIRGFHHENVVADLRAAAASYARLSEADKQRILRTPLRYVVSEATLAQDLALYGQFGDAVSHAQAFLEQNRSPESRAEYIEVGNAHFGLAIGSAAVGDPDHARLAFERARAAFQRTENYQMISNCLYWELSMVSQVYDADRPYRRAQLRREEIEVNLRSELTRSETARQQVSTSDTAILDGLWDECRRSAEARLGIPASHVPSARKLAHLDWLQGRPEQAWAHIEGVLTKGPNEPPGKRFFQHRHELQWIAAELALDAQDLPLALAWIAAVERWLDWSGKVAGRYIPELLRSRYHELQNAIDDAERHALQALELASTPREPLGVLAAHRALARLELRRSAPGRAAPHIQQAAEIARKCGGPYESALTQLVHAELYLAERNTPEARRVLGEAHRIAEYLGASPLLERIGNAMQAAERAPRGDAPATPFGLTRRELEILRLVSQGMTDAAIADALSISPRTVGGHLQSIFNKTGASSRTAATALAYQRGIFTVEE